ncbi:MAG: AMP-binding protein, partial [Candidatus Hydrogenedentota bacterium]
MSDAGIQFGDTFISRDEVMLRSARGATGLSSLGVGRDDTVAMMLRNDPAYLEATMAIRIVSALPVPINWHLRGEEVEYIIKDSGAKALVIHSDLYDELKDHVPEGVHVIEVETPEILIESYGIDRDQCPVHAESKNWYPWLAEQEPWTDDPVAQTASMIYTSGTTGRPKGVRREASTPEQYEKQVMVVAEVFGLVPGSRTIIPAPLYHAAPNGYAIFALQLEAFIVIMPRFDAEEFLRLIQDYKITR